MNSPQNAKLLPMSDPDSSSGTGKTVDMQRGPDGKWSAGHVGIGGRPRTITALLKEVTGDELEELKFLQGVMRGIMTTVRKDGDIVHEVVEHKDRVACAMKLLEYRVGKPTQAVAITGADGGPVQIETTPLRKAMEALKPHELESICRLLAGGNAGDSPPGESSPSTPVQIQPPPTDP